jgi:ribonuclease BN (tRNA processing enzyme)
MEIQVKIAIYGTRGSTPGQPKGSSRYGGNTTCLRIISDCLPPKFALAVDGGSGIVSLSSDLFKEGRMHLGVIFTHYHHDHTQGMVMAGHTFAPPANVTLWGPYEHKIGPREVMKSLMCEPFFPVNFERVADRFAMHNMPNIGSQVLLFHPVGGAKLMPKSKYSQALRGSGQAQFGERKFPISECLVVLMLKTVHPENTISYRFEEKPTGRVFVFLTDHETTASFPMDLVAHIKGAHLLIQDAQYEEQRYKSSTGGFGHATPQYAAETADTCQVLRLGLTHHDPAATDTDIDARVGEAVAKAKELGNEALAENIFGCADYDVIDV